jgi:hypothetical protein
MSEIAVVMLPFLFARLQNLVEIGFYNIIFFHVPTSFGKYNPCCSVPYIFVSIAMHLFRDYTNRDDRSLNSGFVTYEE